MEGCDAVVNFAAESHVDRSIDDQDAFARTHVIGTGVLLDAAREAGVGRFLQVSTDEVYGSIEEGTFTEESPLARHRLTARPRPAATCWCSAHGHTHGLEAVICRGSNNYGPRQYPEKLIPLMILNASTATRSRSMATGCRCATGSSWRTSPAAIHAVLMQGAAGRGLQRRRRRRGDEHRRREGHPRARRPRRVAHRVREGPARSRPPLLALLGQGARPGLGAAVRFAEGLKATVDWYRENEAWWEPIRSGEYREYYERQYGRSLAAVLGHRD